MDINLVLLVTAVVSFLTATLVFINHLKVRKVEKDVNDVHILMNSRLDELVSLQRAAAFASGVEEGRDRPSSRSG